MSDRGPVHALPVAMFLVERGSRNGRVKHELVKIGVVADGIVDDPVHVFGRVVFQADDGRAEDSDSMGLERSHQIHRVYVSEFFVGVVLSFQAHPHP